MADEVDLKDYFEREIKLLKEFINEKFLNMEKQQNFYIEDLKRDIDHAHEKIRDQERKIQVLDQHVILSKESERGKIHVWKKIQESFWGWLIPFILMAILFTISNGGFK
jgi:hypothetical protein